MQKLVFALPADRNLNGRWESWRGMSNPFVDLIHDVQWVLLVVASHAHGHAAVVVLRQHCRCHHYAGGK